MNGTRNYELSTSNQGFLEDSRNIIIINTNENDGVLKTLPSSVLMATTF